MADVSFVAREIVPDQPAPITEVGPIGWARRNLFSSPLQAVLTFIGLYLIWIAAVPLYQFLIADAVWTGESREACLGEEVGACWAFVRTRLNYFTYGLYPEAERWRVNLVFLLGAIAIGWMLWLDAPRKGLGALYAFVLFPLAAYYLLTGLALPTISLSGGLFVDWTQVLPVVETNLWGGILVTLIVAAVGIVFSLPIGIILALGRRSPLPLVRLVSTIIIEFVRGVPLITVLFMASVMLPLFLPGNLSPDKLLRALVGVALFSSAYMAEVIRGGLQALPRGQYEGAMALGLGYWKMMYLIILPQALKIVIPGIVNSFIALFKDTTLVFIVGIFDLLRTIDASLTDPSWATPVTRWSGYAFAFVFYFVFCFAMSRYSLYVEHRLSAGQRR